MKKTIAVINQKGGVGKTTISINLSGGLAISGKKRVLLIDLDPQANTTLNFGIIPEEIPFGIHDVLMERVKAEKAIIKTRIDNLDLIPTNSHLDRAEQLLLQATYREERLKRAIRDLDYEYIVIDCRPTLSTLTLNAMVVADLILVPIIMDRYSLYGFNDLLNSLHSIKAVDPNFSLDNSLRILLNAIDLREKVVPELVIKDLEDVRHLILNTRIRKNSDFKKTQYTDIPLLAMETKPTKSVEDYISLTHEIINL